MLQIFVCVGTSCFIKGSNDVLNMFKAKIAENGLEDKVDLRAAFCLGKCGRGVTVKIGDEYFDAVNSANIDEIFTEKVLNAVTK